MSEATLEVKNVSFSYGDLVIFERLNFCVRPKGEVISILGPSGVGKSTLLYLVLGTRTPQEGSITVRGSVLPMIQNFKAMVLPWFSAGKNVTWGLGGECKESVGHITRLLEIDSKLDAYPVRLSGGQVQRLVLARALARTPDLLLLDEPLSSVDLGAQRRIMPKLRSFITDRGISTIWITHSIEQALFVSDRIVLLQPGGHVHEVETKHQDKETVLRSITLQLIGEQDSR